MNIPSLDALLLFVFSVPLVMQYRILPVVGTPYWLFGMLFILLGGNVFLSLYPPVWAKSTLERTKTVLLWIIITIVLGGITVTSIVDRHTTAPIYGVHDIVLQEEAAMRFLLMGKNPYKETYVETPMKDWHYSELGRDAVNPALFHFVMPPWYLLFPFAFYVVTIPMFGYFDGRMALLFAMAGILVIVLRWFKNHQVGRITAVLLALSPGAVQFFIEGRSDVFALFWFLWSVYLLDRKSYFWSAVVFGLALLSKQTIWFAAPFYLLYLYRSTMSSRLPAEASAKAGIFWQGIMIIAAVVLVLAGPFLWWDAKAFIDSVVLYVSGGTAAGYPVSGYGLGMVLYDLGIIKDIHAYYPFILWQIALGVPAMIISLRFMAKKLRISRLFVGYAVTLLVVWYVSRYFNNSHVVYVGTLFILGVLKDLDERQYEKS